MTGKQDKFWPICTALALHLLAAVFLFFGLSGPGLFSLEINKLNLAWVSLETKTGKVLISEAYQTKIKDSDHRQDRVVTQTVTTPSRLQEDKEAGNTPPEITTVNHTPQAASPGGSSYAAVTRDKSAGGGMSAPAASSLTVSTGAYPSYRDNPRPDYPEIARLRGYEGMVLVAAEVLVDGRVGNIRISRSSGYGILDEAAMQTVRNWKFEPARKSGKPYNSWVELPIKFLLQDDRYQS